MDAVIHFVLMPIFWIPVVGILGFLTYLNYKKLHSIKLPNVDSVLLMLEIPRTNDKKELAAEQMFASLHGILRDSHELKLSGGVQEHLSFEIVSTAGQIRFYVWTPKILQDFVEGQIYSQYPTVQIYKMEDDYVDDREKYAVQYSAELGLVENEVLPIKTFDTFEVDPLAGITGTLAKLDPDHSEEMWIQILTRPIADDWHKKTTDKWVSRMKAGNKTLFTGSGIDWTWVLEIMWALFRPPAGGTGSDAPKTELSERVKTQIAKAEEKATKLGYDVKIRLAYLGSSDVNAKLNMQALVGTFKQFNSTNLNGFKQIGGTFDKSALDAYKLRQFAGRGFILNISELASVYHLPHTSVETPNIVWASSKTAEPPAKLPVLTGDAEHDANISAFGLTNFRGINHQFGLTRRDRSRHVYIIGQTGAGKSGLLELLALSDIFYDQGYCIIDPHGDFAIDNLKFVPETRIKDVVYFNPADTAYPVAFNPLEVSDPSRKPNICSEVIGVLKRMFGDSWGPRLEHILRYTLLALLDRPTATLLDISRMLTDKDFRKETLDYCNDVTVLQFWKHEFGQWNEKQVNESIAPVLNKVGAFTANPIIRNIVGQAKSSFDIRRIMDEGKILVVNLSKGLIGEDNAGILGAFLVTKVQLAAMSRSDIARVEDRRPFYLYVDEFQNFATDSFAVILSEARKYGLNLTVANQYVAQMTESVRDAVFGNVGTTISFRVSADDAPILVKQFEPTFEASDLLQLNNRHFVISMIINGEKVPAFSATTLSIPQTPADNFNAIVESSRGLYARPRAEIEAEIRETIEQSEKYKKELSDSGREAGSRPNANAEHTPNSRLSSTPADFRRVKLSPNEAEGKDRLGLKDLAQLVANNKEKTGKSTSYKGANKPTKDEKNNKKGSVDSGNNKGVKPASKIDQTAKQDEKKTGLKNDAKKAERRLGELAITNATSKSETAETKAKELASDKPAEKPNEQAKRVTVEQVKKPSAESVKPGKNKREKSDKKPDAKGGPVANSELQKSDGSLGPSMKIADSTKPATVTPDIVYQEKSVTPIDTNERSIDLSRAVKDPSKYAGRDNSMDGFLSIRH